jgi:serine protease Do
VGLYTVDQLAVIQLHLSVDKGVVIVQVAADSPADKAGLKEGDVIVGVEGQEVKTLQDFTKVLLASQIGQPIEIQYYRGNILSTVTITPVQSPKPTATN